MGEYKDVAMGKGKIIYPELSYLLTGICFEAHNSLGRFCREQQYGNFLEGRFSKEGLPYVREYRIGEDADNIVDFFVGERIFLELKAKRLLLREDFYQLQRYLQKANIKLGLLVNFRNRYLKPVRIVRIETDARKRFV